MIIVGIDPGLTVTGYAFIEFDGSDLKVLDSGDIKTSAKLDLASRIAFIYDCINELCQKHNAEIMVIEKIYTHPKYPQTAVVLAHARAMAFLAAKKNDIKAVEMAATSIKKSTTSSGRASKSQMIKMASHLAGGHELESEHAADALSMAISYAYKS